MNEGAFDLVGATFTDRTAHQLAARHPEHGEVNVVVQRSAFPVGKSLRELVSERHAEEQRRLPGFTLTRVDVAEVGGLPAIVVSSRFRDGSGNVGYQRQAHFALGETWVQILVAAPMAASAVCDDWFDTLVRSIEVRREAES